MPLTLGFIFTMIRRNCRRTSLWRFWWDLLLSYRWLLICLTRAIRSSGWELVFLVLLFFSALICKLLLYTWLINFQPYNKCIGIRNETTFLPGTAGTGREKAANVGTFGGGGVLFIGIFIFRTLSRIVCRMVFMNAFRKSLVLRCEGENIVK